MLIEYKIRFDDDGVTISQRIEPGASEGSVRVTTGEDDSGVTTNELPVSFQMTPQPASDDSARGGGLSDRSDVGGGVSDQSDVGGGEPDTAPIIIFGPIIVSRKARPEAQARCPDHLMRDVSVPEDSRMAQRFELETQKKREWCWAAVFGRRPRLFLRRRGRDPV